MATIKSFTDIEQSRKLAEILPLESADMYYACGAIAPDIMIGSKQDYRCYTMCWSLAALMDVLPEINGIPFKMEKVKAKDGYDGYYYHIDYEGIVLIPYSKNPTDACYELILKLNELNML